MNNPIVQSMLNSSTTQNGCATNASSLNACVDFFFQVGAMRGSKESEIVLAFASSYDEDPQRALKLLFWARDVLSGAGERRAFRCCLGWLAHNHPHTLSAEVVALIPAYGRWDDVLTLIGTPVEAAALSVIRTGLESGDALCAKWMPREKSARSQMARIIRESMGISRADYRKTLSRLTKVVESQMCNKDWDNIDYSQVPSQAMRIYKDAFARQSPNTWTSYVGAVVAGEKTVNAGAIHPHEILSPHISTLGYGQADYPQPTVHGRSIVPEIVEQQWKALPNWLMNNPYRILPIVDTSGSMETNFSGGSTRPIDVSVSLGLYISERNNGPFKDCFVTFSEKPKMQLVSGRTFSERLHSVCSASWGTNTNLEATFTTILSHAKTCNAAPSDMPDMILILSDMEFDECCDESQTAMESVSEQYAHAGYSLPKIVFWNLGASKKNVPVRFDKSGAALVSGFSPSIMKSLLTGGEMTAESIMLTTIDSRRYTAITHP